MFMPRRAGGPRWPAAHGLECAAAALLAVALRDEKVAADVDEGM
jgi:hypothetical protein